MMMFCVNFFVYIFFLKVLFSLLSRVQFYVFDPETLTWNGYVWIFLIILNCYGIIQFDYFQRARICVNEIFI